jgi:hypothetical protein
MGGYRNERLSCSFIHDRKRGRERKERGRVSVFQTHQEVIVWESWEALCPCLCLSVSLSLFPSLFVVVFWAFMWK